MSSNLNAFAKTAKHQLANRQGKFHTFNVDEPVTGYFVKIETLKTKSKKSKNKTFDVIYLKDENGKIKGYYSFGLLTWILTNEKSDCRPKAGQAVYICKQDKDSKGRWQVVVVIDEKE